MTRVHKIKVGSIGTNCYFLENQNSEVIIVDPGGEPEKIINFIKENNFKPIGILITHKHWDHIDALKEIKQEFNISVGLTSKSGFDVDLEIMETPGHTPDGICIISRQDKFVLTGDTLFKGTFGRTDLPGGNMEEIKKSLKKILELPEDFVAYPGHGSKTTIGEERKNNSFLTL